MRYRPAYKPGVDCLPRIEDKGNGSIEAAEVGPLLAGRNPHHSRFQERQPQAEGEEDVNSRLTSTKDGIV